ncbi:MAG: regulatory protein RecX [Oscillospiraceae bacterium]|nr:regulatory protein RecX [Oscillospiraceae bacterium]
MNMKTERRSIQVDSLSETNSLTVVRQKAILYIGISHKSSGRVKDYLSNKGYPDSVVESVVQGLKQDGYIDDLRVARSVISTRQEGKAEGKSRLKLRLLRQGIPEDVADDALRSVPSDSETIHAVLTDLYHSEGPVELGRDQFRTTVTKCSRFLLSRGYSYDLISYSLTRFFSHTDQVDPE